MSMHYSTSGILGSYTLRLYRMIEVPKMRYSHSLSTRDRP